MIHKSIDSQEFNEYAGDYDHILARGLAVSGEGKNYFAQGRIDWLKARMDNAQFSPRRIMDYGCGTGETVPLLLGRFDAKSIVGVDQSTKLIERARRNYSHPRTTFRQIQQYHPAGEIDLVYCNGVFHHIPIAGRAMVARDIWRSLTPDGYFAFWENNPWNPGTQYVMSRIEFDRDAITLTAAEAGRLLQSVGFEIVRTDYLFIFPKCLSAFRWMESHLSRFPFGGQYLVLARKSGSAESHA
jgi:SAM-dependent methyltransferase